MINKDIILMITLYEKVVANPQRFEEYKTCLQINLQNKAIYRIVIFFETLKENFITDGPFKFLKHPKIELHTIKKRPYFGDFFAYANKHHPNKHIAVCNGDIFFLKDSNIEKITQIKRNEFWLLTRYEFSQKLQKWTLYPWGKQLKNEDGDAELGDYTRKAITNIADYHHLEKEFSEDFIKIETARKWGTADTFCFHSPIKLTRCPVFLGGYHCEQALTYQLLKYHYNLLNPAFSIISLHFHRDSQRNYPKTYHQSKIFGNIPKIFHGILHPILLVTEVCHLHEFKYLNLYQFLFIRLPVQVLRVLLPSKLRKALKKFLPNRYTHSI